MGYSMLRWLSRGISSSQAIPSGGSKSAHSTRHFTAGPTMPNTSRVGSTRSPITPMPLDADQIGIHYEAGISSVPEPSAPELNLDRSSALRVGRAPFIEATGRMRHLGLLQRWFERTRSHSPSPHGRVNAPIAPRCLLTILSPFTDSPRSREAIDHSGSSRGANRITVRDVPGADRCPRALWALAAGSATEPESPGACRLDCMADRQTMMVWR